MIKYFVNEKKRSVIGVLENTSHDCINYVCKNAGVDCIPACLLTPGLMPDSFRTEVKCHPDDEFDVEVGKKIAKERILENYWRSRRKAMIRLAKKLEDYADTLEDFAEDLLDDAENHEDDED